MKLNICKSLQFCIEKTFSELYCRNNIDFVFATISFRDFCKSFSAKNYSFTFRCRDNLTVSYNEGDDYSWFCEGDHLSFSEKGSGFVDLIAFILGVEYPVVINKIKSVVMSQKYYVRRSLNSLNRNDLGFEPGINKDFIPNFISYNNEIFNRKKYYSYKCNGREFGKIVQYCSSNNYFEVLVEPYFVEIEGFKKFYYFLNYNYKFDYVSDNSKLYSSPCPKILLCDDFALSCELNKIIFDSKRYEFSDFVSISFMYTHSKTWEDFCRKFSEYEIFYIPSGSRESFTDLNYFKSLNESFSKFRIFKKFVFYNDGSSKHENLKLLNRFDRYLHDNTTLIDLCTSDLLVSILRDSVAYPEYSLWCSFIGLTDSKDRIDNDIDKTFFNLQLASSSVYADNTPFLDSIFSGNSLSFIYGKPKIGKTVFVTSLFYYLSMNFSVFGIDVLSKKNVCVFDFSNSDTDYYKMLNSIHHPYFKNMSISKDFNTVSLSSVNDVFSENIGSDNFKNFVENCIKKTNCEIIIFDSFSLISKDGYEFQIKWSDFNNWIKKIQNKYSISVVFVFEILDKSNYLDKIYYNADNIIKIESINSADSPFSGCRLCICYEIIKSYPILNGAQKYFCKPIVENNNASKWIQVSEHEFSLNKAHDLSGKDDDNYKRVLNFIKSNNSFTRKDIDKIIGKSTSLSQKILKKLLDDEAIKKIGKTKNTSYYYKL